MPAGFSGQRDDGILSLSAADRAAVLLEALAAVALAALFFFRSALAAAVLMPLIWPVCRRRERAIREKRRAELLSQFGELTQSLITALKAGYSPENAFREATADMTFLCGENSMIVRELFRIERGMSGNIPLEQLLMSFADRSGLTEVREFAEVFSIAKRSGGSMVKILERTARLITERIDLEQEISVMRRPDAKVILASLDRVVGEEELARVRAGFSDVTVSDEIAGYIMDLVESSFRSVKMIDVPQNKRVPIENDFRTKYKTPEYMTSEEADAEIEETRVSYRQKAGID